MIKLTRKVLSAAPAILTTTGEEETKSNIAKFEAGTSDFEFKSAIYGHDTVKAALIDLQDYKCCFCESKIGHVAYGDVEHFRPKAGWVQDDEGINKPGYYWLAYDWDNLMLSCQICNQRYKKNYFPIELPDNRARDHKGDIAAEGPLFIHPVNDEPEEHIEFNEEIPKPKNKSVRGEATIKKLALDRELLNEERRTALEKVKLIAKLAMGTPETDQKEAARALILKVQTDSHAYASMFRCFFRKNPINF